MTVRDLINSLHYFNEDDYVQIYAEPNEDPEDYYYTIDEVVDDMDDDGPVCLIVARG